MQHKRVLRAGEAIKREVSVILDRKMSDPRIGMVTVTRIELTDDLRYAKLYVSFLGDDDRKQERMKLLRKARRFVRSELSHAMRLRIVPELTFVLDDSSENFLRINEVIKRIHEEEGEEGTGGPGEDPADA